MNGDIILIGMIAADQLNIMKWTINHMEILEKADLIYSTVLGAWVCNLLIVDLL